MAMLIDVLRWGALAIQFACCWGLLAYAIGSVATHYTERFAASVRQSDREQTLAARNDWQKGQNVLSERRTTTGG